MTFDDPADKRVMPFGRRTTDLPEPLEVSAAYPPAKFVRRMIASGWTVVLVLALGFLVLAVLIQNRSIGEIQRVHSNLITALCAPEPGARPTRLDGECHFRVLMEEFVMDQHRATRAQLESQAEEIRQLRRFIRRQGLVVPNGGSPGGSEQGSPQPKRRMRPRPDPPSSPSPNPCPTFQQGPICV